MANTLSALTPTLYSAAEVVSQELAGGMSAVTLDFDDKSVAKGDSVKVPLSDKRTAADFVPGAVTPEGEASVPSTSDITLDKSRKASFVLTGEESRSLANGGTLNAFRQGQLAQCFRTICNEVEADLNASIIGSASRAYGVAGTTPFASDLSDGNEVLRILRDNGAPGDRSIVIDTAAGVNVRNQALVTNLGADAQALGMRGMGDLINIGDAMLRESSFISGGGGGTLTAVTADGANAVGATSIAISGTTVSLAAGDVITFTGDTNQYVVVAALSGDGVVQIGGPGLRKALAGGEAVDVIAAYTGNYALSRQAAILIARPTDIPSNGVVDYTTVSAVVNRNARPEEQVALTFGVAELHQYGQTSVEVHLTWNSAGHVIQPEHVALLLG
jgi:hypothetical protein